MTTDRDEQLFPMAVMGQEWVEVLVSSDMDAGELLGMLNDPDVSGAWQEHDTVRLYWPASLWHTGILHRVEAALKQCDHRPRQASLAARKIPAQDWNARWAESVKPVRIGHRFVIRPSWQTATLGPQDIELIIDPNQAFGTGHHATTQLLVEWLVEKVHGGERVLDLGTGSGILAMAALRLGARFALGLDIDAVAIDCARENAAANGFGLELQLHVATFVATELPSPRPFDLIVANLDRRTILAHVPELLTWVAGGSCLLVSGILREDRDDVAVAFGKSGMAIRSSRERDGWLALEAVRGDD